MTPAALSVAVLLLVFALSGGAQPASPEGTVIYVSPQGQTGAEGTAERPLASVQEALDRARAGDTVRLRPGVYQERVSFRHDGEFGRPVVLEGEPGAVIDGSERTNLDWQPAEGIAPGVYRATVPFRVFTVTANGKIVTALDERRTDPATQEDPKWQWPNIFRDGIGPTRERDGGISGWEGVKGLVMYRREQQELLIRFQGDLDPRKMTITVAPDESVVSIVGVDRCVVRGLTLRNAARGVDIEDSLGSAVERCVIGPTDFGVMLRRGADRCTVRFNEIFMAPYAGASPELPGSWDNWLAHKEGGFYDRTGIAMHSSRGGHQIHDNYIHDHWDGIEDYPEDDQTGGDANLNIHHNLISICSDDGLEPNGEDANGEWHDNIVEGCICGFRIKAPRVGPLYAYRNIFFDNGEDYRNFGGGDKLYPAPVYVYQNTSTCGPAISHSEITGIGTPNYHFLNNFFWCTSAVYVSRGSVAPNWSADYNVYLQRGDRGDWQEGKARVREEFGQDAHSAWVEGGVSPGFRDFAKHDVSLLPDSPPRGKGVDLSRYFGKPLPGCEPGYFSGEAPDAGALQFGQSMPRIPRRPEDVAAPAAGWWPGAEGRERGG